MVLERALGPSPPSWERTGTPRAVAGDRRRRHRWPMTATSLVLAVLAAAAWTALGGERALRELYRQCGPRVMAVALRLLRDRGEAEDVAQETFLELWRRAGTYDDRRASPATWAVVIARSRAIDRLRARASTLRAEQAEQADPPAPPAVEAVEAREERERVLAALPSSPPSSAARWSSPSTKASRTARSPPGSGSRSGP